MVYILIAIILFAALSFAFTSGNRASMDGGVKEVYNLYASEILQYAAAVKNAVKQAQINGCSETDISFDNPIVSGYAHTPAVDEKCQIFNINGGGLSYVAPQEKWLDTSKIAGLEYGKYHFNGTNWVVGFGASSTPDLVLFLPWLTRDLCLVINEKLGVDNPGGAPPKDTSNVYNTVKFVGSYTSLAALGYTGGSGSVGFVNYGAACFEGDNIPTSGTYHFYKVLISR